MTKFLMECEGRSWEVTLNGDPIMHLFDAAGSETFDATEAVEAHTGVALVQLVSGDVISFHLITHG